MKKAFKIVLISLGSLILIVALLALGSWLYIDSKLLSFEDDYIENLEFQEISQGDYTFLDRNGNGELDPYEDNRLPTSQRVENLLSLMTTEEKIHLLKGSGIASAMGRVEPGTGIAGAVGTIVPTPRLGLPTIYLSDGPAGLRIQPKREGEDRTYYCTAFPIGTLLSSTWNTNLVHQVGDAMGTEAKEYGIDVILGPGANIHRHPLCGRNFEYYSEDPVLTGMIGAAMVNGIESNGVGTSVKHYVANNQETERFNNDAIVSERALREIYLRPFEIIVKQSQPWTIMSSYNKVNGTSVSESRYLMSDVLRDDWGYEGLVMTDWFGGYNAPAQINAGNDLLEPGTKQQWDALKEAYENGELSEEVIDVSVGRILKLILESRKFENLRPTDNPDLDAHARITRQSATEGMVLLKNNGTLPLSQSTKVALLGVTSYEFIAGGTGSGDVNEAYTVSLEQGMQNAGFEMSELAKSIYLDHKTANPEAFVKKEGLESMLNPYDPPEINYSAEDLEKISEESDLAIITIGRNSGEGFDRIEKDDFLLTEQEQDLLEIISSKFHSKNKKVVVVLNIGGVIETASWKNKPDAILLAWQGGQEGGNSVVDLISGKVNPSGKLPMTFPINLDDHASNANFPKEQVKMSVTDIMNMGEEKSEEEKVKDLDYTLYEEGIYVGYRHFDKQNVNVSFPFGYGLSYTDFAMTEVSANVENDTIQVALSVTNNGEVPGMEVVQIYSGKPESKVDRPVQELRSFAKTAVLEPGESQQIRLSIPVTDLQYWEEDEGWVLENGPYEIRVGSSSRNIEKIVSVEI